MAYIDPYDGNMPGVLAKFSFKMVYDEDFDETNPEVGFDGDLDYAYSLERFDKDAMEGNVWVWVSSDADVNALKSHSSFVGSRLLLDLR
tara:strand:+ start:650 stop:916 length:267 start_codon:yes stop_codon:yes gene_type:complete